MRRKDFTYSDFIKSDINYEKLKEYNKLRKSDNNINYDVLYNIINKLEKEEVIEIMKLLSQHNSFNVETFLKDKDERTNCQELNKKEFEDVSIVFDPKLKDYLKEIMKKLKKN